ncbi:MAG: prepilin-type N-terminal cleavage/methylation domain-containing protein [Nitrospirae bacterium]|nr:prepilin-type N-terminal cleavage/methylation domain-containing protein [Nitrospirota bacterium]
MPSGVTREEGFTLIELMVVVAIIGILAAIAMVSYRHFTDKAKSVEAEVALAEIDRLEMVHYANRGIYSDDLNAIGFSLGPALKYYQVAVQVQNGGTTFQAMAFPTAGSGKQLALVLTRTPDGQASLKRADPTALAAQIGGKLGGSGIAGADPTGAGGATPGAGGGAQKASCREGGEASLAADGLLDMSFCLK